MDKTDPIMNRDVCVSCGREMLPKQILAGTYLRIIDHDETVDTLDEGHERLCFRYRFHLVCADCLQVGITTMSMVRGINEMMREVWGIESGDEQQIKESVPGGEVGIQVVSDQDIKEFATIMGTDKVKAANERLSEAILVYRKTRNSREGKWNLAAALNVGDAHLALEDAVEEEADKISELKAIIKARCGEQDKIAKDILAGRDKVAKEKP